MVTRRFALLLWVFASRSTVSMHSTTRITNPMCVRVCERERGRERGREREKRKRKGSERERERSHVRERGKVSTKHMKSVLCSLPHPRIIYAIYVHRNSFMNKVLKQTNHIRVCSVRLRVCRCTKRHQNVVTNV